MAALDDIRSHAEGIHQSLDEVKGLVRQAWDEAKDLEESAAGHGWAGVSQAMSSAQASLKAATSSLDDALEQAQDGMRELTEITDEMSSDEVARRLGEVGQRLENTRSAATQATSSLDEARESAQQADAATVYQLVDEADDALRSALGTLDGTVSDIDAERSEATSWGS